MICTLLILFLLFGENLAISQNNALAPPPTSAVTEQTTIAAALDQTKRHQSAKALELYRQALAVDSNNAALNLLAAGAAIETLQPAIALQYAQRAQQLDPSDWKVHLTLLVAYAGTGKLKERDDERELVRRLHSDGKHPDATQANGFMVEYFPQQSDRVRAVEYFAPLGKQHFSFRFMVYDPQQIQTWTIALESDDLDQPSWAAAHRELAAAGEREYSLEGYGSGAHVRYRSFSGKPSYDEVRTEVVRILNERKETSAP